MAGESLLIASTQGDPGVQDLPAVTTLLFTDIEGSTRLWEETPERMRSALASHDALARAAVEDHHGVVVKMTGDGLYAAFEDSLDAVSATLQLLQAFADPEATNGVALRVRCGLHAGVVERRENDYFGSAVNRAARIMGAAHGGQSIVSQAVVDRVANRLVPPVSFRDLGAVRLRDLARPERVYQVVHPQLRQEFPALRSLEATPNNLPQQLSSFVGREQALAEVSKLLGRSRLLTLVGVGGLGKTRLSLQVGADVLDDFADGVWLIELAPLSDSRLVAQAVASVLGVKEEPGRPAQEALVKFVKDRQLLLILDNCEHLAQACAELAKDLLQAGPQVKVLASSREPLHVFGETTYPLSTLAVPDPRMNLPVAALTQYEAVRLFSDRALAAQPGFRVTDENATTVGEICHRLDGIPLALELAAARVRALSVETIAGRLSDRFRLLTRGDATALPRQQTLRACMDWSYDLLTDPERALLRRLAVFAGGWTLDAAEVVGAGVVVDACQVLDLLTHLVDKSLVGMEEGAGGEARYRLLETIRQYGWGRLEEAGEMEAMRVRHLAYFLKCGQQAASRFEGPDAALWYDRIEADHGNLRAALDFSMEQRATSNVSEEHSPIAHSSLLMAPGEAGLLLAGALWRFWWVRGYFVEARARLVALLARTKAQGRSLSRAGALYAAGVLAREHGDYAAARTYYEENLAINRAAGGSRRAIANTINSMGNVHREQGDYETALALYEECLNTYKEIGDTQGVATVTNSIGNVRRNQGDYAAAQALFEESLALNRGLDNIHAVGIQLLNLAHVRMDQGDFDAARAFSEQALEINRKMKNRPATARTLNHMAAVAVELRDYAAARACAEESLALFHEMADRAGLSEAFEPFAVLAAAEGETERAVRLWAVIARMQESLGSERTPVGQTEHQQKITEARTKIGNPGFDAAWAEGSAMTQEQAVKYALG